MTESMIERVARALFAHSVATNERVGVWDGFGPDGRLFFFDKARAAIAAMREPTEAMHDAGEEADKMADDPSASWRAMIDAALKE